mmetsp:Transcript_44409/g.125715  ORF Transcript_44409/g.125715 Transcript_44409/m.125715 type:complete len:494 (-) Transcript_44409:114-1595(-)
MREMYAAGGRVAMCTWCLLGLVLRAQAQLRILAPESLARLVPDPTGRIDGATSTFGAPFYGDRILGQLIFAESTNKHCHDDDYRVDIPTSTMSEGYGASLINIIMVRRGLCTFVTKVRVAHGKGAHAVIFVDREDSEATTDEIQKMIVADDGTGSDIHIPSILVSKGEGNLLIEALKTSKVVVELVWNVPTNHVVSTDLWMSSGSATSLNFLKEFSPKRRMLNEVLMFQPHFAVFSMDRDNCVNSAHPSEPSRCRDLCSNDTGEFCTEDPDGPGPITGRQVLDENLRQACIHEKSKVPRTSLIDTALGKPYVEYAEKYWNYIEKFADRCPLDGRSPAKTFGTMCAEQLMLDVGLDLEVIRRCMARSQEEKLLYEREHRAWSPRALRINGWHYRGIMSADLVTRAICSAFIAQPKECKEILKPRDPFKPYISLPQGEGVTSGMLFVWLLVVVGLVLGTACFYKRYLKSQMRATLREEVMLEVQAQIGDYSKLHG